MLDVQQLGDYITAHFSKTLFRLETLDQYEVASDGNDFGRYLANEPEPDWARKQPWLDHLRREASQGLYRHRVHVLRGPLTDYLRYECEWGYAYNSQAGEDIRILDLAERREPEGLVDHDFWLIDDAIVLRMHYSAEARFVGAQVLPESLVTYYQNVRAIAWESAEPFDEYWRDHQHYRRASSA